jgi:hypothetical protein
MKLFGEKKVDQSEKLLNSIGFGMGEILFAVPTEKDGYLSDTTISSMLYGFSRGLSLRLWEHGYHLRLVSVHEEGMNFYVVMFIDTISPTLPKRINLGIWILAKHVGNAYVFMVKEINIDDNYILVDQFSEKTYIVYLDGQCMACVEKHNIRD